MSGGAVLGKLLVTKIANGDATSRAGDFRAPRASIDQHMTSTCRPSLGNVPTFCNAPGETAEGAERVVGPAGLEPATRPL